MRRPAPLPSTPEKPEAAEQPVRRPRVPRDEEAGAVVTPMAPADDDASAEEAVDGIRDQDGRPLTQRDVWRAARARRKALKSEIRRFTQRSRRRRMIWIGSLGALVLLVGATALAAYSPLFAVEKVTVVGASTLDPAAIEQALADQVGTPLALVDASEVKAALVAFPLIETYALEAKPPHELTVRIVERTPVGVISSDAGYTLVDAAGVALATTDAQPEGQPILDIEGGTGTPAFESAGLVVRSLPADLRGQLTRVQASSPDDVTLTLGDRTVVWGSAEESALKAFVLSKLVATNPDARTFDVTAPNVGIAG
ncbi:FtsQ-type POTRA domain-containing protein [Microbacterium sp. CIAB417]|uniref:FtsQ-type POTRA domain-containing protein n=1 Tax=Microbacterium sp. CIAB417 TaxID=2860287 RepID=UPI001FAD5952|nr:FtsQ-type POTRA domain-containing protein [Microbacterium sp. CIAB417]